MLHITIELWPLGDEEKKQFLGALDIANDGTGSHKVGNYMARYIRKDGSKGKWTNKIVNGFKRLQHNSFDLLFLTLGMLRGKQLLKDYENSET